MSPRVVENGTGGRAHEDLESNSLPSVAGVAPGGMNSVAPSANFPKATVSIFPGEHAFTSLSVFVSFLFRYYQ